MSLQNQRYQKIHTLSWPHGRLNFEISSHSIAERSDMAPSLIFDYYSKLYKEPTQFFRPLICKVLHLILAENGL